MGPSLSLAVVPLETDIDSHEGRRTVEKRTWAQRTTHNAVKGIGDLGGEHKAKGTTDHLVHPSYGIYPAGQKTGSGFNINSCMAGEEHQTLTQPPYERK